MATAKAAVDKKISEPKPPRPVQPKCKKCSHSKSFHGRDLGRCNALGCKCAKWVNPPKETTPIKSAPVKATTAKPKVIAKKAPAKASTPRSPVRHAVRANEVVRPSRRRG